MKKKVVHNRVEIHFFGDQPSGRDTLLNKLLSRVLTSVGIKQGYTFTGDKEFCLGESTPLLGMNDFVLRRSEHSLRKWIPFYGNPRVGHIQTFLDSFASMLFV